MEDQSPYQASRVAPAAATRRDWRDEPPREITSPIKHMWVMLAIGAVAGGIGTVGLLASGDPANRPLLVVMAASFVIYGLATFGVYKRSRAAACAVLVLCGFGVLGTLLNISNGQGSLGGVGFTALLAFVSVRGTLATFRYHRHMRTVRSRPPRTRLSEDPAFAPKVDPSTL
jgi:hypothetical protein